MASIQACRQAGVTGGQGIHILVTKSEKMENARLSERHEPSRLPYSLLEVKVLILQG
jgi:hypothetical protein